MPEDGIFRKMVRQYGGDIDSAVRAILERLPSEQQSEFLSLYKTFLISQWRGQLSLIRNIAREQLLDVYKSETFSKLTEEKRAEIVALCNRALEAVPELDFEDEEFSFNEKTLRIRSPKEEDKELAFARALKARIDVAVSLLDGSGLENEQYSYGILSHICEELIENLDMQKMIRPMLGEKEVSKSSAEDITALEKVLQNLEGRQENASKTLSDALLVLASLDAGMAPPYDITQRLILNELYKMREAQMRNAYGLDSGKVDEKAKREFDEFDKLNYIYIRNQTRILDLLEYNSFPEIEMSRKVANEKEIAELKKANKELVFKIGALNREYAATVKNIFK